MLLRRSGGYLGRRRLDHRRSMIAGSRRGVRRHRLAVRRRDLDGDAPLMVGREYRRRGKSAVLVHRDRRRPPVDRYRLRGRARRRNGNADRRAGAAGYLDRRRRVGRGRRDRCGLNRSLCLNGSRHGRRRWRRDTRGRRNRCRHSGNRRCDIRGSRAWRWRRCWSRRGRWRRRGRGRRIRGRCRNRSRRRYGGVDRDREGFRYRVAGAVNGRGRDRVAAGGESVARMTNRRPFVIRDGIGAVVSVRRRNRPGDSGAGAGRGFGDRN